jgi:hypothetical protein
VTAATFSCYRDSQLVFFARGKNSMSGIRIVIMVVVLSLSSLTAHAQINLELGKARNQQSICLHASHLSNFRTLSSQHVLFRYDAKNYYLMTMQRSCFGLRDTSRMYPSRSSKVCGGRRDEISFEDKLGGVETCQVDTIDYVESRDAAKALIKERKEAKKKKKDD